MCVSLQNIFNIYRFLCVRKPFTYRHSIAISTVSILLFNFDSLNRIQPSAYLSRKKDGVNQTHRLFYDINDSLIIRLLPSATLAPMHHSAYANPRAEKDKYYPPLPHQACNCA